MQTFPAADWNLSPGSPVRKLRQAGHNLKANSSFRQQQMENAHIYKWVGSFYAPSPPFSTS